jgi:hypothetical protein
MPASRGRQTPEAKADGVFCILSQVGWGKVPLERFACGGVLEQIAILKSPPKYQSIKRRVLSADKQG